MKKKYIILILFLFITITIYLNRINIVLTTKSYSYLPKQAKNLIKEVYKETGTILKTEINKTNSEPYLNPKYISYLELSSSEREKIGEIPQIYITDIKYTEDASIPDRFSLKDTNQITPIKDQSTTNLCWAFSTTELAESHLMVKNNKTYNSSTQVFNPRQIDYASSINGITNYTNTLGIHQLNKGGSFLYSSYLIGGGLGLVDDSWMAFNTNMNTLPLSKVLNYENSLYEFDETISFNGVDVSSMSTDTFNYYINTVGNYVMNYGGAYVGTEGPGGACTAINTDGSYIIDVDSTCTRNAGHALQIIGWDKNYNYKYCKYNNYHTTYSSSCPAANIVEGRGAWILRNSWGNNNSYVYLAFDSLYSDINILTKLTTKENRTWNNVYMEPFVTEYSDGTYTYYTGANYGQLFNKKISGKEKIEKIKLITVSQNSTYTISLGDNQGNILTTLGTVTSTFPGLLTLDLTNKNFYLDNDNFSIIIQSSGYSIYKSTQIFTSSAGEEIITNSDDRIYKPTSENKYDLNFYADLKNVKSNTTINYDLVDRYGNNLNNYLNVTDNTVAINNINTRIKVNSTIPYGVYNLKLNYNKDGASKEITSLKLIYNNLEGTGEQNNPYIITKPTDIYYMEGEETSYYKINNNLDLSNHTLPIKSFKGNLNGNNKELTSLKVNLFDTITSNINNDVKISNIYLKDINGTSNSILINKITKDKDFQIDSNDNIDDKIIIDTISFNGKIENNLASSTLINNLDPTNIDLNINNIFSNLNVKTSGYGLINTINESDSTVKLSNIEIFDIYNIKDIENVNKNNYGFIASNLNGKIDLSNSIINGYNNLEEYNVLYGTNSGNHTSSNVYYTRGEDNLIEYKKTTDLTNSNLYTNWKDFNTYWTINEENNIKRIPLLNIGNISYTKVNEITVKKRNTTNILDYINIEPIYQWNLKYKINGDNASINNNQIEGLKVGETTINITNDYDGYNNNVKLTVLKPEQVYITFDSNGGTNQMDKQIYDNGLSVKLNKNLFHKEGYIFKEWNTSQDGTGTNYLDEANVNFDDDITLYAIWTPITYKIVYNYNNGTPNKEVIVEYDKQVIIENEPLYEGHTFIEWNTKEDSLGTKYTPKETVKNLSTKNNDTINLYAIYDKKHIEINYHYQSGVVKEKILFGSTTTIKDNTEIKIGYIFDNWNTKEDGTGTKYEINTNFTNNIDEIKEIDLYPIYKPITYKIVYHYNNGTPNKEVIVEYDKQVIIENEPLYEGHTFIEWNTKEDSLGTKYTPKETVKNLTAKNNDSINLYAIYDKKYIEINYHYSTEVIIEKVIYNHQTIIKDNTENKIGYIFDNWNTKEDGTGTKYEVNADFTNNIDEIKEIDLYPIYKPITYKIVYHYNNGTPNKELILEYDKETTIEDIQTKEGHTFIEWNTKEDSLGTKYTPKETVKNLSTKNNDTINLYAIYDKKHIEINYHYQSGVVKEKILFGSTTTIKDNTEIKIGYIFDNWNTKEDGTGTKYEINTNFTNNIDEIKEIDLYPVYTPITYKIIYTNGVDSYEQILTYDKKDNLLSNNFIKDKYLFNSWNTSQDGTGTNYIENAEIINLTTENNKIIYLYPTWIKEEAFKLNDYILNIDNKYIDKINHNTTLNTYMSKFTLSQNFTIKVFKDNKELTAKDLISTNSITKIYKNNILYDEFINIIRGDINCDGKLTPIDYIKVKNHILGNTIITDKYLLMAANANEDAEGKISPVDYIRIKNIIIKETN